MTTNIPSLHAKLLNIAREKNIEFQLLINRFGAEQFLDRLSRSSYVNQFVFKGGSLLAYLIETERKTKDLDFTIKEISNQVNAVATIIGTILAIPMDDGIQWGEVQGSELAHPDMDYPGVRIICPFLFGKAKGSIRMDMAIGEVIEAVPTPLKRIRYKLEPLMGEDFSILSYPRELIFAEKLQIAVVKGQDNTRMRDYYDLFKLLQNDLDPELLKSSIRSIFEQRETPLITEIRFDTAAAEKLQTYWKGYAVKSRLPDAPGTIVEIMNLVNEKLREVF